MEADRLVRELFYIELLNESQLLGRLHPRFKDTCKNALKFAHILDPWMTVVDSRQEWRRLIRNACESHVVKEAERR